MLLVASAFAAVGWFLYALAYGHSHQIEAAGLFPDGQTYVDLTAYIERFDVFRTSAFFELAPANLHRSRFAYPPAAALCYAFLYKSKHMKLAYNLVWSGALLAFLTMFVMAAKRTVQKTTTMLLLGIFILLSYPAVFLFERANIEILVWGAVTGGTVLYLRRRPQAAALCFGLAAAIKIYPILLLSLFLKRREERTAILTGGGTAALITTTSIAISAPHFFKAGARGFLQGIVGFQTKYGGHLAPGDLKFDHSLFTWVKLIASQTYGASNVSTNAYYVVCGLIGSAIFLLWVNHRPDLNRLAFCLVMLVTLPPVSFEYTLVHLYFPLAALVILSLGEVYVSEVHRPAVLLAISSLLTLALPIDVFGELKSFAGQIQVALLLLVAFAAAWKPWTRDHPSKPAKANTATTELVATALA